MKKLLTLALITFALTACKNTTSELFDDGINQNYTDNLASRNSEEFDVKDPEGLTLEETEMILKEAAESIGYFENNPRETEMVTSYGRKAVTLCHTPYSAMEGSACVYNTSGYLVRVTWEPASNPFGGNIGIIYPPGYSGPKRYYGSIVKQCNC